MFGTCGSAYSEACRPTGGGVPPGRGVPGLWVGDMSAHDVPTCYVSVQVMSTNPENGRSSWVSCPDLTDLPEFVYCRKELDQVLNTYCTWIAAYGRAHKSEYPINDRFRVLIRGAFTKRQTAIWEWRYVGREGRGMFVPDGEPWVAWPRYEDVPEAVREEFLTWVRIEDAPADVMPVYKGECRGCPVPA